MRAADPKGKMPLEDEITRNGPAQWPAAISSANARALGICRDEPAKQRSLVP